MADLREQIVLTARAMLDRGLVTGTTGNVSARVGDGMLITPTRVHPYDLRPESLVELALDGTGRGGDAAVPSLEWPLHATIYAQRPDAGAIVHTHSPHAMARSFDPTPLFVRTQERTYLGLERIDVAAPCAPGSEDLATAAVEALGDRQAVLLARHGVVTVAATPRDALELAATVEHQAQVALLLARP
jgi:L-fuculose-phosphate aldolase